MHHVECACRQRPHAGGNSESRGQCRDGGGAANQGLLRLGLKRTKDRVGEGKIRFREKDTATLARLKTQSCIRRRSCRNLQGGMVSYWKCGNISPVMALIFAF